jgi:hypothetical protein
VLFVDAMSVRDAVVVRMSAMAVRFQPSRDGDPQTESDQRYAGSGIDHRSVTFAAVAPAIHTTTAIASVETMCPEPAWAAARGLNLRPAPLPGQNNYREPMIRHKRVQHPNCTNRAHKKRLRFEGIHSSLRLLQQEEPTAVEHALVA